MRSLIEYFGAGKIYKYSEAIDFRITKIEDITDKVIAPPPFFDKYKIIGIKSQDFSDFKRVALLIKNKAHLTEEGLDKIRKIKLGMNKARK